MPLPDAQQRYFEIVLKGTQAAAGSGVAPAINVFNYYRVTVAAAINKAQISAAFAATVVTPLLAAANARYSPNLTLIRNLDDKTDLPVSTAVAGAGAIATDSEPSDDAVYILLRSSLRGKSYRGGKHFAGTSEVDTTGDVLTGAGLTRWQAVRDACKANFTDAGGNVWAPVIVSRKLSNFVPVPAVIVSAFVSDALLDLNIGTMRRRRTKTVR